MSTQDEAVKKQYDFPTEIIPLPSKGLLYPKDSPLHAGKIEIKYMTAKEEDILSTESYIVQNVVLDKLCESIILTKGVKYNDLLVGDKNALLIAARAYGYGYTYDTTVTKGDQQIPIQIDLRKVPHKDFKETLITPGVNQFSWESPSGVKLDFKLLTVGDQKIIDADLAAEKKLGSARSSNSLTARLRKMILSVDGKGDQGTINKYVINMLASDSRALRKYITAIQPDIDLSVEVEDPTTGNPFLGNFTIGLDLFYPDFES